MFNFIGLKIVVDVYQYLLKMVSTSLSILILRIESLRATSLAILEAAISAFNLDLATAFSVSNRLASS